MRYLSEAQMKRIKVGQLLERAHEQIDEEKGKGREGKAERTRSPRAGFASLPSSSSPTRTAR